MDIEEFERQLQAKDQALQEKGRQLAELGSQLQGYQKQLEAAEGKIKTLSNDDVISSVLDDLVSAQEHYEELLAKQAFEFELKRSGLSEEENEYVDPIDLLWQNHKGHLELKGTTLRPIGSKQTLSNYIERRIKSNKHEGAFFQSPEEIQEENQDKSGKPVVYTRNGQINLRGTGYSLEDVATGKVTIRSSK
ncbi:hypothetical protein IQ268_28110 [Oculatella sp. LEGE 06141]|uniref:hypothetical protein n=1 Tax=Oculatella sp. LEGE 06141 TaxID=1828648 RepID=UPI00187E444C|nr:hypothetical protein [Oculatella sp. LEGE 06141]MBE9182417.1 hypothetical protein [Oculatella sp. LEGE 06141]